MNKVPRYPPQDCVFKASPTSNLQQLYSMSKAESFLPKGAYIECLSPLAIYHGLGGFNNKYLFLTVLKAVKSKIRPWQHWFLVGAPSWCAHWVSSCCVLSCPGEKSSPCSASSSKGTNLIHKGSSFLTYPSPEPHL